MRASSNPVFRSLPQTAGGGYASFDTPQPGAAQYPQQPYPGYQPNQYVPATRAMTIDDVVTKTGITLGVLGVSGLVSYLLVANDHGLAAPLGLIGLVVGMGLAVVAIFTRRTDNPAIVLSYAVAEGLVLGAISFMFTNVTFGGAGGVGLISQAVLGTFGVFAGMLIAYKTGAIRVTPRLTKMIIGATFGLLVLMLGNWVAMLFTHDGFGLRSGGPVADRLQPRLHRHRGVRTSCSTSTRPTASSAPRRRRAPPGASRSDSPSRSSGCTWRSCACSATCTVAAAGSRHDSRSGASATYRSGPRFAVLRPR